VVHNHHYIRVALRAAPGISSGPVAIVAHPLRPVRTGIKDALDTTPAVAIGIADRPWSVGDLMDAALAVAPPSPTETAPERRRQFRVIQGGKRD
jgi:hypothetical protein